MENLSDKSKIFPTEGDPADKIRQMLDNSDTSSSEMNKIDNDDIDFMSNLGSQVMMNNS